jgi:hypothetical protein
MLLCIQAKSIMGYYVYLRYYIERTQSWKGEKSRYFPTFPHHIPSESEVELLMSTLRRIAERLMRFSGLDAAADNENDENEEVLASLEDELDQDEQQQPRAAKRVSVEINGKRIAASSNSTFENSSIGNNSIEKSTASVQAMHLRASSLSNKVKGTVYRKQDRNALSESLSFLFQNEILTDMVVVVDEKEEIRAHRAVLASQSPYLRRLIEDAEKEQDFSEIGLDESLTIVLDGISYDVAEKIIGFMYSGKIVLTDNNVIDVFLTSNLVSF